MNWPAWAWTVAGIGWVGLSVFPALAYGYVRARRRGIRLGMLVAWRVESCDGVAGGVPTHDAHATLKLRGTNSRFAYEIWLDSEGARLLTEQLQQGVECVGAHGVGAWGAELEGEEPL